MEMMIFLRGIFKDNGCYDRDEEGGFECDAASYGDGDGGGGDESEVKDTHAQRYCRRNRDGGARLSGFESHSTCSPFLPLTPSRVDTLRLIPV